MRITYSVFFSGTGHKASDKSTLVYLLKEQVDTNVDQKTIEMDGCAITPGFRGMLFGAGLDKQCQEIIRLVERETAQGNEVTLNVYGHGRGAIGAQMLAKQLSAVDPKLIEINLALLDPVPGNFITTATLDVFDISPAKKTMDLRECKPLKRVLALYPYQALPTLAAHAPLFNLYPKHTVVEEDVIAGCHAQAQFQTIYDGQLHFTHASFISFARIFKFLKDCGTNFKPYPSVTVQESSYSKEYTLGTNEENWEKALCSAYQAENQIETAQSYRDCHSATGISINTKAKADYFNLHHQRLAGVVEDKQNARVTIEYNQDPISQTKRAMMSYPKTWQAIKWTLLSLGLSSLVFFTGGLAVIPLVGGVLAYLGTIGIAAAMPIVGGALAVLWYGGIKPLSKWAINLFFYPWFYVRDINAPVWSSHRMLADQLGGHSVLKSEEKSTKSEKLVQELGILASMDNPPTRLSRDNELQKMEQAEVEPEA